MQVKLSGISETVPSIDRAYTLSLLKRRNNFDTSGKKVDLPPEAKLNTLIASIANETGNIQQKEFYFNGNQLILSEYQRRIYTPELIKAIAELGKKGLKEDSEFKVVVVGQDKPLKERNYVTASDFFSYNHCPHRVWRDAHSDPKERDPVNAFMKLLWEKGIQHENDVMESLGEYVDLSDGSHEERVKKTLSAMEKGIPLIYHSLLVIDELKGEPDILQKQADGTYMPIDIKSALAFEGLNEGWDTGKMKEYYAMQLSVYIDALIRLGFAKEHRGVILDKDKNEVIYDLDQQRNKRDKTTFWELYHQKKEKVLALVQNREQNDPALFSGCKLCHWYSSCKAWCQENEHSSLIYKLGRSFSDKLREDIDINTVRELARVDVEQLMEEKEARKANGETFLHGIGDGHLVPMVRRARYMASGAKGVKILNPISFPKASVELHIDLETDPTQDLVYMHGVVIRKTTDKKYHPYNGKDENIEYKSFVAEEVSKEAEEKALREFWNFVRTQKDYIVYHYSHYEKTMYRKLMEKYPGIVTSEELTTFFNPERCVDLYKIIDRDTDWPLSSYSLKDIAKSVGFDWRVEQADTSMGVPEKASGAASIRWFNDWVKAKQAGSASGYTDKLMQKILDYNEDDCIATVVVKDYLEEEMKTYIQKLEEQLQKTNKETKPRTLISLPVIS